MARRLRRAADVAVGWLIAPATPHGRDEKSRGDWVCHEMWSRDGGLNHLPRSLRRHGSGDTAAANWSSAAATAPASSADATPMVRSRSKSPCRSSTPAMATSPPVMATGSSPTVSTRQPMIRPATALDLVCSSPTGKIARSTGGRSAGTAHRGNRRTNTRIRSSTMPGESVYLHFRSVAAGGAIYRVKSVMTEIARPEARQHPRRSVRREGFHSRRRQGRRHGGRNGRAGEGCADGQDPHRSPSIATRCARSRGRASSTSC